MNMAGWETVEDAGREAKLFHVNLEQGVGKAFYIPAYRNRALKRLSILQTLLNNALYTPPWKFSSLIISSTASFPEIIGSIRCDWCSLFR